MTLLERLYIEQRAKHISLSIGFIIHATDKGVKTEGLALESEKQ